MSCGSSLAGTWGAPGDPWDFRSTAPNLSILIVPPTEEPITLAQAKLLAGLDWPTTDPADPRDAQMAGFITAARERVERDTGIALLTQTRHVYLSHPVSPPDFPAPARPLQSVADIHPPTPPPDWPANVAAALYPYAAEIVVGYHTVAEIPPLLVFAVGLLTAHYATAGRDLVAIGTIVAEMPLGYEDAIGDFRRVTV